MERFLALALLAQCAHALSWAPVGASIAHPFILASSCAFSDAGQPLLAFGAGASASDPSTTTFVLQWTAPDWRVLVSHTPQFAQPYEHFSLRSRLGHAYVGLVINPADGAAAGLSSILRDVTPGSGEDGMEGATAFGSTSWAFDVNATGAAVAAVASADNASLSLTSYPGSGWAGYPASGAWAPLQQVAAPAGGVGGVAAVRGAGEELFVAYSAAASGSVQAGATPLNASGAWRSLGTPFGSAALARAPASPPALAHGGGTLCAAAHGASAGEVLVACARSQGAWAAPALALTGAAPGLAPGLALQPLPSGGLRVTLVAGAASGAALLSATCDLPASGAPVCAPAALPPLAFGGAPVTDFDLCSPASGQAPNASLPLLLAVAAGPADGTGDSLVALTLA
jgi:hypothetical protein